MKTISTYTRLLCLALASLIATSCSDHFEELTPDSLPAGHFTLKASQQGADTRLELGQDGLTVQWEPGDQLVLVEKSRSKAPIYLSCTLTEPATQATFISESGVPAGDYWVIYNYNENLAYTHQSFSSIDEINANDKLVLYGELNITTGTSTATVTMQHLYAMINIQLKNIPDFTDNVYDRRYQIGVYSSKKGFGEYKLFTASGIVNASQVQDNMSMNTVYRASDKKRHNLGLGDYFLQSNWVSNDDGNGYYQNNLNQLEAMSALVLPEDLSDEDVYFYVLYGDAAMHEIKCWEIKKPVGMVNLMAGKRYTVTLDMSETAANTQVSTLTRIQDSYYCPYGISTGLNLRHLAYLNDYSSVYIAAKLLNDIDLTDEVFFPINECIFDGDGKTIRNLTLERPDEDNVGFMKTKTNLDGSYTYDISISNLTLENATIKGKNYVAAFKGYEEGVDRYGLSEFKNCKLTGSSQIIGSGNYVGGIIAQVPITNDLTIKINNVSVGQSCVISGASYVGGIVGAAVQRVQWMSQFTSSAKPLDNCIFEGEVNATGDYVGGIFGKWGGNENNDYTEISFSMDDYTYTLLKCQNKGKVKGNNYVGGIGGSFAVSCYNGGLDRVVLKQSFSDGTVEGNTFVGGIVGGSHASINTCYSIGSMKGTDNVGGIMGGNMFGSNRVANCYSLANVEATGADAVSGGLVGVGGGGELGITVTNSYFAGTGTLHGIIGKSGGSCCIDHCLTTLASFCSNWGEHFVDMGGGSYQACHDTPLDPIQDGKMIVGVTSILDHKDFINADNAYSSNYWDLNLYPWYCVKFDSFSADTDAPDFDDVVIP